MAKKRLVRSIRKTYNKQTVIIANGVLQKDAQDIMYRQATEKLIYSKKN